MLTCCHNLSEACLNSNHNSCDAIAQGPVEGGAFKQGGFPIWTRPSRFVLFFSLGLSERVRETIRTFHEKVANPPVYLLSNAVRLA